MVLQLTIKEALAYAQQLGGETPRLDIELLLAHLLAKPRTFLFARPEHALTAKQQSDFLKWVSRRASGEPIAYLLGIKHFWSMALEVAPCTLIPRPETELLVSQALELMPADKPVTVLDLGTGCGAVALALATERPKARVLGVDLSLDAVNLATRNAANLALTNCRFSVSDWFATLRERFDLIVSNPPYVAAGDPHLEREVSDFEPASALFAKQEGLADLRHIIHCAGEFLNEGGHLLLEHGWQQASPVREMLSLHGFCEARTWQDLAGSDRVSGGTWPKPSSGH